MGTLAWIAVVVALVGLHRAMQRGHPALGAGAPRGPDGAGGGCCGAAQGSRHEEGDADREGLMREVPVDGPTRHQERPLNGPGGDAATASPVTCSGGLGLHRVSTAPGRHVTPNPPLKAR